MKIVVFLSLAVQGLKVRREAELMRSTSWSIKALVRCSKCLAMLEGCCSTL